MRAECYNPDCSEPVTWQEGIHEAYCSWDCAIEAREGEAETAPEPEDTDDCGN